MPTNEAARPIKCAHGHPASPEYVGDEREMWVFHFARDCRLCDRKPISIPYRFRDPNEDTA